MLFRLLTALAALAVLANPAIADIIKLKNGRSYEGKVIAEDKGILQLQIRGGKVSIPVTQIESREKSEFKLGVTKYSVKYREITLGNDKELAEKIAKNISDGKIDFEEAAKRYSTDEQLKIKGGERGWLAYNDKPRASNAYEIMMAAKQEKLFSLAVGKVSSPIRLFAGDDWHIFLVEQALFREDDTGRLLDADGNPAMPDFQAILVFRDFTAADDQNLSERAVAMFTSILKERAGLTCFNDSETHVQAPPADYTFTGTIKKSQDLNVFQFSVEVFRGDHKGCGEEGHQHAEESVYSASTDYIIGTDMLRREVKRIANLAYSAIIRDAMENGKKKKDDTATEDSPDEHDAGHEEEGVKENTEKKEHVHGPGCSHGHEKKDSPGK